MAHPIEDHRERMETERRIQAEAQGHAGLPFKDGRHPLDPSRPENLEAVLAGDITLCPAYKPPEADPTGKAPGEPDAKLDAGKAPVFKGLIGYFPRACQAVAEVSAFGASKYAWNGWQTVPEGVERYGDALARHLVKKQLEGPNDAESGLLHKAHAAWNAMAVLELALRAA